MVFICFIYSFIPSFFFCNWKLLLKFGGSPFLQRNHIPASGHQFFQFFQRFFKFKAFFPHSENMFFNILHPAGANGVSAKWKQHFLVRAISLL